MPGVQFRCYCCGVPSQCENCNLAINIEYKQLGKTGATVKSVFCLGCKALYCARFSYSAPLSL